MNFKGKDIISIRDLKKKEIEFILDRAREIEDGPQKNDRLQGKILANLFFEPSTRTRLSFESAMKRLGGSCVGFASSSITSVEKGETLIDTIKTIENYCDAIVIRHPKEGSSRLAAQVSSKPIINAGDGSNQHPTQTLLDIYTIMREKGKLNVNVALMGDLKYSRTVHSLIYALAMFDTRIFLVSPPELEIPGEVLSDIQGFEPRVIKTNVLEDVISDIDVLYLTRIQKERFPDEEEYEKIKGAYKITLDSLKRAKKDLTILHPLPKIDEIDSEIDGTKYAKYFKQAYYGLPVRMALLSQVMGD